MEWFKMLARYPDDPAIQAVGDYGELLFGRACAYAARAETDGFIPDRQVERFGLRSARTLAASLVREGLWEHAVGGWQITNWVSIQSEAYAAERRRRKDRNRKRVERASSGMSVECPVDSPQDSPWNVHPLEVEEERTPLTPSAEGEPCTGQHDNCRGCRTTRRQLARAARVQRPVWCGVCNEQTRLVGYDSDSPSRCGVCHPLRGGVASSNIQLDAG